MIRGLHQKRYYSGLHYSGESIGYYLYEGYDGIKRVNKYRSAIEGFHTYTMKHKLMFSFLNSTALFNRYIYEGIGYTLDERGFVKYIGYNL